MSKLIAVSEFIKNQQRLKYSLYIYAALVDMGGKKNQIFQQEVIRHIKKKIGIGIDPGNVSRVLKDMEAAGMVQVWYKNEQGELTQQPEGFSPKKVVMLTKGFNHFL